MRLPLITHADLRARHTGDGFCPSGCRGSEARTQELRLLALCLQIVRRDADKQTGFVRTRYFPVLCTVRVWHKADQVRWR